MAPNLVHFLELGAFSRSRWATWWSSMAQLIKLVVAAIGTAMIIMGATQMFQTLRTGRLRARGGRIIKRKKNPVMFWLNFGGLIIVCVLGVVSIIWALLV